MGDKNRELIVMEVILNTDQDKRRLLAEEMESTSNKGAEFISYPTNRVMGTIDDPANAQAAAHALLEAGFSMDEIDVLCGEEGVRRLDATGKEHGLLARLNRAVLQFGEEPRHIRRYEQDLLAGHFVLMVLAEEPEKREKVKQIMTSHGGHSLNFYGKWVMEGLES